MISKIKNHISIAFILFIIGYLTYLTATFSFVRTKYINNLERQVKNDSISISELNKTLKINDSLLLVCNNDNILNSNNVKDLQLLLKELKTKNSILEDKMNKIEKNGNIRYFIKSFWSNKYTEVYENPTK